MAGGKVGKAAIKDAPAETQRARKSRRSKASKGATAVSLQALKVQQQAAVKKHLKAERTTKTYSGHLDRGRGFLEKQCKAALAELQKEADGMGKGLSTGGGSEEEFLDDGTGAKTAKPSYWGDEDFAAAFSDTPNKCSPVALVLLLTHKVFIEECSQSTVDGVYSAFKDFWTHL